MKIINYEEFKRNALASNVKATCKNNVIGGNTVYAKSSTHTLDELKSYILSLSNNGYVKELKCNYDDIEFTIDPPIATEQNVDALYSAYVKTFNKFNNEY